MLNPSIAASGSGSWLISDTGNHAIRRLTLQTATQSPTTSPTPSVTATVGARPWNIYPAAGTGTSGNSGNGGAATAALIGNPGVACKDGAGGFYFVREGSRGREGELERERELEDRERVGERGACLVSLSTHASVLPCCAD
jgi:hypothetical protein